MGRTQVSERFSKLKSGVTSVEDPECSGCLSKSKTDENVDRVKELVHENIRITTREVANMLEISFWLVQSIL
jgi:hypothetical protein